MTTSEGPVLRREIRIDASPETVFPFFTDPQKMVQWGGMEADLDPVPGGIYRVNMNGRDVSRGEYVEITPNSRLVFTWGWESDGSNPITPGSTRIEITLEPDGDGTILTLTHTGLPESAIPDHTAGWDHYLGRLAIAGRGDDPGPDSMGSDDMES